MVDLQIFYFCDLSLVDNFQTSITVYEAFFEGIIFSVILIICFNNKNISKNFGVISGIFLILYSLFRYFIEFLREPDAHLGLFFNFVSMGQILSIPLFIYGVILIIYNGYKKKT